MFPYIMIYCTGAPCELWRTDEKGVYVETIATGSKKELEDKYNRLHIEHFGSPLNYSVTRTVRGLGEYQEIRKMDVPWDMIDKVRKPI